MGSGKHGNSRLTLYTTSNCPRCQLAQKILNKKNLAYDVINLGWEEKWQHKPDQMADFLMRCPDKLVGRLPVLEDDGDFFSLEEITGKLQTERLAACSSGTCSL